eukprot:12914892-Prorocentrum_lima.AAC.1
MSGSIASTHRPPGNFMLARKLPKEDDPAFRDTRTDMNLDAVVVPIDLRPPYTWTKCAELEAAQ